MTRIESSKRGRVEAFINKLRRENKDFDIILANSYNYAMRNQRKDWGIEQLKLLRIAYQSGERNSPANES